MVVVVVMSGWRSVGNGFSTRLPVLTGCDVDGQMGLYVIPHVFFCFRWRCFLWLENIPSIRQENLLKLHRVFMSVQRS